MKPRGLDTLLSNEVFSVSVGCPAEHCERPRPTAVVFTAAEANLAASGDFKPAGSRASEQNGAGPGHLLVVRSQQYDGECQDARPTTNNSTSADMMRNTSVQFDASTSARTA